MKRFAALSLVIVGILALVSRPSAASYSLTLSGTWQSADGLLNGPWTAQFDVAGFDLSGNLNVIGMPGVAQGNIVGTWDLSNVGFGLMFLDQEVASFTGGLHGNAFTGTFETGDLTGNWTGSINSLSLTNNPVQTIVGSHPALSLNQVSGTIGSIVNLVAKLTTQGSPITSTVNSINFNNLVTQIVAKADGSPNCMVNPGINAASFFQFLPAGCQGSACTQIEAIIQSLSNTALPDGANLYTCKVQILESAAQGIYQMVVSNLQAFDGNGASLQIDSFVGEIVAKVKKLFGGCDCSIAETAGYLPLPSLLAPFVLLLLRSRVRRS